jgi:hypothetical protein
VGDVHAESQNAISKTRTPVNAACLITDPKLMCGASPMQPAARDGGYGSPLQSQDGCLNSEVPRAHSLAAGIECGPLERCWLGTGPWLVNDNTFFRRRGASGKQEHHQQSKHSGQDSMFFHWRRTYRSHSRMQPRQVEERLRNSKARAKKFCVLSEARV